MEEGRSLSGEGEESPGLWQEGDRGSTVCLTPEVIADGAHSRHGGAALQGQRQEGQVQGSNSQDPLGVGHRQQWPWPQPGPASQVRAETCRDPQQGTEASWIVWWCGKGGQGQVEGKKCPTPQAMAGEGLHEDGEARTFAASPWGATSPWYA